jgi:hypothetical protein
LVTLKRCKRLFANSTAPGQTITARVYLPESAPDTIKAALYVHNDNYHEDYQATGESLTPGAWHTLTFQVPALKDACLSEVGVVLRNLGELWETGSFHIASLDWSGAPDFETTFAKERAESGGISQWTRLRGYWRLENGGYHGGGPGECESYTGDIRWTDYVVEAEIVPLAGNCHNINVRVQGAQKSYAFGLGPDYVIALYKKEKVYSSVAGAAFPWEREIPYRLSVTVSGDMITGTISASDGRSATLTWQDTDALYLNGQIGLSTWYGGHMRCNWLRVRPLEE